MDMLADTAQRFIDTLNDMIHRYESACGKAPEVITVSHRAYLLLEQYASDIRLRHSASGPIAYFKGIEVRIVTDEYYDARLSGDQSP